MPGLDVAQILRGLRARAGMSRDDLARAIGMARGQSLARYEDSQYWTAEAYPVEFVAKLAAVLIGKGDPPITPEEIWGLAELKSGLLVVPAAVFAIPILGAEMLKGGAGALKNARPSGGINVAGLEPGNYFAVKVDGLGCERLAPAGAYVIIDTDQTELRDGRRYLVILNGEPEIRLYNSNPARFESEAMPPGAAVYPTGPVDVLGRAIRIITDI